MATCIAAWYDQDDMNHEWAVFYEDGIAYTVKGLPDQDEARHVQNYHAGKYCPVMTQKYGQACAWNITNGSKRHICHDPGLAGKW